MSSAAPARPAPVVEARGLVKRYGSLVAVDEVSFRVEAGEVFGLLGPNGAGKTTTLEMLEGLRRPDAGEPLVLGESMVRSPRQLKHRIGVQLQATALPPLTTVREAVELFAAFYERHLPTDELLSDLDLSDKASSYADKLSGGQMQRLSVALALVNEPELVFLDEPTTGLDPQARLRLWDVVERIRAKGATVILTTHYMEEAERLCDRVGVMDQGRLVALDTPTRLVLQHAPGTTIEFDAGGVDLERLRTLPGVEGARLDSDRVVLRTTTPERVLAALFDRSSTPVAVRDLRMHGGTLEDVFLALTGHRLQS